jgi:uncharacterized phiE125 gp8 family phage protein
MTLNANALCTLAEAKDYLDIPTLVTEFDARVERYINAASQLIEEYTDRKLIYQAYDLKWDGRRSDRILFPEYPVIAITKVWDDPSWEFTSQEEIPATDWMLQDDMIILRGRRFSRGNGNVRIQFTAGYQSPTVGGLGLAFPATLSHACLMTVDWLQKVRDDRRTGVSSKGKQGENISFSSGLPEEIKQMVADFVRFEPPLADSAIGNA